MLEHGIVKTAMWCVTVLIATVIITDTADTIAEKTTDRVTNSIKENADRVCKAYERTAPKKVIK